MKMLQKYTGPLQRRTELQQQVFAEIDESGALTVKEVPDGKLSTKIVIKATRKSDESTVVTKQLLF